MENVIFELSKYIVLLFITIYTLLGFRVVNSKNSEREEAIFRTQRILLLLIQFILNLVLYLVTKNIKIAIFYVYQLVFVVAALCLFPFVYHHISKLILNNMLMFLAISFVMLERLSYDVARRQFFICIAGLFICLIVPLVIEKMKVLKKFGLLYAIAGIAILVCVFVFGEEKYGAKNWLNLFGVSIQPSEFVKLLFVFFVASAFTKRKDFKHVVFVSIIAGIHVLILVAERDLGAALILSVTYLFMLYIGTSQPLYLFGGLGAASVASVLAYRLFAHVRQRVNAWRNPWADITGDGFQVAQSLFAIGTGGWFGLGLGRGLPTKIPVVKSDFIFSAISEELGGIFALCILLLYLSCFVMFINIAIVQKNTFYKMIALGFSIIFIFQVFLCVGGATKFIPSTGVTLPLISNGGTSILSTMIIFSVMQGLHVLNQVEDEKFERKKKKSKTSDGKTRKRTKIEKAISE